MAAIETDSEASRPSTLKSYVERFRKGDPTSRAERRTNSGGGGDGGCGSTDKEDFWWWKSDEETGAKRTVAERPYQVSKENELWTASPDHDNGLCVSVQRELDAAKDGEPRVTFQLPSFLASAQDNAASTHLSEHDSFQNCHPQHDSLHHSPSLQQQQHPRPLVSQLPPSDVPPDRTDEQQLDDIITRKLMYQRQQQQQQHRNTDWRIGDIPAPVRDSLTSSGVGIISSQGLGSEGTDSPEDPVLSLRSTRPASPPAQLQMAQLHKDNDYSDIRLQERMRLAKRDGVSSRLLRPSNPEEDILYQWRLRRKLQDARDGVGKKENFMRRMEKNLESVERGSGEEGDCDRVDKRSVSHDELENWRSRRSRSKENSAPSTSEKEMTPSRSRHDTLASSNISKGAVRVDDAVPASETKDVSTSPRTESPSGYMSETTAPKTNHDVATSPLVAAAPFPHPRHLPYFYQMPQFYPHMPSPHMPYAIPVSMPNGFQPYHAYPPYPPYVGPQFFNTTTTAAQLNTNNNNENSINVNNNKENRTDDASLTLHLEPQRRDQSKTSQRHGQLRPQPESGEDSRSHNSNVGSRILNEKSPDAIPMTMTMINKDPKNESEKKTIKNHSIDDSPFLPTQSNPSLPLPAHTIKDLSSASLPALSVKNRQSSLLTAVKNMPSPYLTSVENRTSTSPPPVEISPSRDMTVVSSLSSSSSRDDISSIVDEETMINLSDDALGSQSSNEVRSSGSAFIDGAESNSGSCGPQIDNTRVDRLRGCGDDVFDDNKSKAHSDFNVEKSSPCSQLEKDSRPSRCEDFESDESEFEDDEILIVLRKKRKELIKKLWMIDEFMNKKV